MKTTVSRDPLSRQRAEVWILFCFGAAPILPRGADATTRRLARMTRGWIGTTGFAGKAHEVSAFPCWEELPCRFVVLAGLGPRSEFHVGRLYRAAAAAVRSIRRLGVKQMAVSLPPAAGGFPCGPAEFVRTVAAGADLGRYEFARYLSVRKAPRGTLSLVFADAAEAAPLLRREAARADALAGVLARVRDLSNLPANEATPAVIAREACALARAHGLSCRVAGAAALRRQGCEAFLTVARGSRHEAQLVTLKYRGTDPRRRPIVLIGKTITFDSGGISLKTAKNMEWMKYDKAGGMAVLAATLMAARLRVRHPVVGMLAIAENMPGGNATRPGDIVRSRAGKTIEILNTDAEGRLVLADALSLAGELRPEAIVDLATLTGAVLVALGHVLSAVMGNSERLVSQLREAGERSGDRLWPLPLLPDYDEDIRGQFADLKNVGAGNAGTIIGGMFLQHFAPPGVPWAHVDIAGTAWEEKDKPYAAAGATLFGARLLTQWITDIEKR